MSTAEIPAAALTDDAKLDATINHLRDLSRGALLQYAVTVGGYLVTEYFNGDVAGYFDPSRSKESSFNALLRDREEDLRELQLSPRTLRNYICAWDVWNGLPENVQRKMDLTDLYKLSSIKDATKRAELAVEAAEKDWTLEQVDTAVQNWKAEKNAGKEKRGPKEQPAYVLHFREMDRRAAQALTAITTVPPEGAARDLAVAELAKLEARVAEFRAALGVA